MIQWAIQETIQITHQMDSRTPFGTWLRQRRKLLDFTQHDLAEQVGCSSITIRKLEAGERKPSKLLASNLARSLQIPKREELAFIQFARSDSVNQSFAIPAWKPNTLSWRESQLPETRPKAISSPKSLTLHYDAVSVSKPQYTKATDGRFLFEASAEGHLKGEYQGEIRFQYTQVVYPKPEGVNIAQALPMRVAVTFTTEIQENSMSGICTGIFYPELDPAGNGTARFQASGHITSITIGFIDFFLSRVFLEDEVQMVEGTGTGTKGTMRLESIN